VRERFAFLATPDVQEQLLLDDQTAHRELEFFSQLRADARTRVSAVAHARRSLVRPIRA